METVWILRNDRAKGCNLEKCAWHFTTRVLLHWLKVFLFLCLFFSHSHFLCLIYLCLFFLSNPPSVFPVSTAVSPLFHCPLTACWLNKWPSFILRLSLMKTSAADRALPLIRLSEMDGGLYTVSIYSDGGKEYERVERKAATRGPTVSFTERYHVKWLWARPRCTTKLSTLIFLACKQKLLLMSNFNSEQQQLDEVQQMDEICSLPPAAVLI